jgi:hypothetical protein
LPITIGRSSTIVVRELPRPGFIFTSATTFPENRLINFDVSTRSVTARVFEGGVSAQTAIFFNNRSEPGQIKVCKVAGLGIPEFTPFTFTVAGTAPLAPVTTTTTVGTGGTAAPGAILQGGTAITQNVTVLAGASGGGFCQVVPGTFVVGTPVVITETGPLTVNGTETRVTRIRTNATTTTPTGTTAGGQTTIFPANTLTNAQTRTVSVVVLGGTTEVEFTNTSFQATQLKICKVAGDAATLNQNFTFTTTSNTGGTIGGTTGAPTTQTTTVTAGPAATATNPQNGFCQFVTGPFGGFFDAGQTVMVTETQRSGFFVQSITGLTGSVMSTNLGTGTGQIVLQPGINEIQFVNTSGTAPTTAPIKSRKRARFF